MSYRIRSTVPTLSGWRDVEADSPDDAANQYDACRSSICYALGSGERVHFAVVEVAGDDGWYIVRTFHMGIFRRGGVEPIVTHHSAELARLAARLGWTKDPRELIAAGWYGEEP